MSGLKKGKLRFTALDFFAGSGLVSTGLKEHFQTVWANDNCEKKAKVYLANHGDAHFKFGGIEDVSGSEVPSATLSWASFPCVDLSLAGNQSGLKAKRSGLYWEWLRVTDEMRVKPKILVIENVEGLYTSNQGKDYREIHNSLTERGYKVGPMLVDAKLWVPQSRARAFIVAVKTKEDLSSLVGSAPSWNHSKSILKAAQDLKNVIFWSLPKPPERQTSIDDIVDWDLPADEPAKSKRNLLLVPRRQLDYLIGLKKSRAVAPGYKRTRNGRQVLELRFDGIAGCLRVPRGGSSRQHLVFKNGDRLFTRLLSIPEATRLMGVPDNFQLPGTYNENYAAMGDAVAYPVVKFLARELLRPLASIVESERHSTRTDRSRQPFELAREI